MAFLSLKPLTLCLLPDSVESSLRVRCACWIRGDTGRCEALQAAGHCELDPETSPGLYPTTKRAVDEDGGLIGRALGKLLVEWYHSAVRLRQEVRHETS